MNSAACTYYLQLEQQLSQAICSLPAFLNASERSIVLGRLQTLRNQAASMRRSLQDAD